MGFVRKYCCEVEAAGSGASCWWKVHYYYYFYLFIVLLMNVTLRWFVVYLFATYIFSTLTAVRKKAV